MQTISTRNYFEMSYCKMWEGNKVTTRRTFGFRNRFFSVNVFFLVFVNLL